MKNLLYILLMPLLVLLFSCTGDEDYAPAKYEAVGFSVSRLPASIPEGTGESFSSVQVPVRFGNGIMPERPVEVTLEIDPSSTAVIGEDFILEGVSGSGSSFAVTIPADTFSISFGIKTITNFDQQEDKRLMINIVSVSEQGINIGYPFDKSYAFDILDDDCPFDSDQFTGDNEATELYSDGPYGPYNSPFVYNGESSYTITNFLDGGGEVEIVVDPDPTALTVDVPQQNWNYAGNPATIVGSGRVNTCGTTILISVTVDIPAYSYVDSFDIEYVFSEEEG